MTLKIELSAEYQKQILGIHDAILGIAGRTDLEFDQAAKPDHVVTIVSLKDVWLTTMTIHPRDVGALLGKRPLEEEYEIRVGRIRHGHSFLAVCRNGTIAVERFMPGNGRSFSSVAPRLTISGRCASAQRA
jgi:hypothetical protein